MFLNSTNARKNETEESSSNNAIKTLNICFNEMELNKKKVRKQGKGKKKKRNSNSKMDIIFHLL